MTSDDRTAPMSEARQAAERAAEQLIPRAPLRDESDAEFVEIMEDIRKEHVARAVPIIESEIAPLLAAKDADLKEARRLLTNIGLLNERLTAERDRLATQVEQLRANLSPHGIRRWWRFDDNQQPLSSWHEREDFIARITVALAEQPHA